ncbi:MAG: 50S ribosomal protein L1 [Planctomycetota bacterium]
MPRQGKAYQADSRKAPTDPQPLTAAVQTLKQFKARKFDMSVELVMHLGIDDKQADQQLRGAISLPHGIGQSKRVIAFVGPEKLNDAMGAGAIKAGGEELVKEIEEGFMDFDVAVAEPAMMRVAARLGRVLGPKGLMPSPKAGTVTNDVATAVKEHTAGKVQYRNDKFGNVAAAIGKFSFDADQLTENAQAFIDHINKIKPASSKGQYIKNAAISATMTPSVLVAV